MNENCHVNPEIHLSFAKKLSSEEEQREREMIRGEININICNGFQTYKHSDNNYYCIFHLPEKGKNKEQFQKAIEKVFAKIRNQIKQLNNLSDDKKEAEKAKIKYDFRYVKFPYAFGLGDKIEIKTDFSCSTFFDLAYFKNAEFLEYANFDSVIFHKKDYFIFAKFQANVGFFSAKFLGEADFKYAFFSNGKFLNSEFSEFADFESCEFVRDANFINASFFKNVNFQYAKLFIANFENATFSSLANFNRVEFLNYAFFRGSNENLVFEKDAILDFQDARIEKPERIIFHTVRLLPNWFVNTDSRKMIFTDIDWENLKNNYRNENLNSELENLKNRDFGKPKQLLRIACRQLAENAENNKSV